MAYATASDVEVELGREAKSAAETGQWEVWLERVERAIRRRFTREGYDLDEQVDLGEPTLAEVVDVEVARVVDKVMNPNTRQSSYTKTLDDGSVTGRYEGSSGGDPLTISDTEWANLLPVKPERSRAFSVMPS